MSYCTECGKRVRGNADFCPECGFDLNPTASLHKTESGSEKNVKVKTKPEAKAAEGLKETSESMVTVGMGVPAKSKTEPKRGTTGKQDKKWDYEKGMGGYVANGDYIQEDIAMRLPKPKKENAEKLLLSNIYSINAFRVLQVSVVASAREIASHIRKLDLKEKLEQNIQEEGIYPLLPPPDGYSRRSAAQRLNDPVSRIIDEIFWFWPISVDMAEDEDIAFTALKQGNIQSAVLIWDSHKAKGSDSIVSMHNLAVLNHITALDLENVATVQPLTKEQIEQKRDSWEQALPKWKSVINSDDFLHWLMARAHEIGDRRLTIDTIKKIREDLPTKLLSINAVLAREAALAGEKDNASYHIALMIASGFNRAVVDEALRCAAAPIRERIDIICANTDNEIKEAPQNANKVISSIMDEISQLLITLDTLLPEEHLTREAAHDEIALLMKRSQIAYVNETEDWRKVSKLLNKALTIAASESVRQNIKDDIETVNNNLLYITCWFCNKHRSDDSSAVPVKMYGDVSRTKTWSGTNVQWHKMTIPVPCCKGCRSAHMRYKNFVSTGGFVGGAAGVTGLIVVASTLSFEEYWYIGLIALAISVCIGLGIGYALGRLSSGIKAEGSKTDFPEVKRMRSIGWIIGEKPTG